MSRDEAKPYMAFTQERTITFSKDGQERVVTFMPNSEHGRYKHGPMKLTRFTTLWDMLNENWEIKNDE